MKKLILGLLIYCLLASLQNIYCQNSYNFIGETKQDLYEYFYNIQDESLSVIEKKDTIIQDISKKDIMYIFFNGIIVKQIYVYINKNSLWEGGKGIISSLYSWTNAEEKHKYKYSLAMKNSFTFIIIELNNKINN